MNIPTATEAAALTEFLNVWSGDLAADVATKLTCGEVAALAHLLRTHGHPAAAASWINFHSHGDDDEDDRHSRTPAAALLFELEVVTATYPDLSQEFEDPETFGAGHVVLYSLDSGHRLAITERCDKPADDETREPIGWQWESAHRLIAGGWQPEDAGEVAAADLDLFVLEVWTWARTHGGAPGS